MTVKIVETPDRYLVINLETLESMDGDRVGFCDKEAAIKWAEKQGYEIQEGN